VADMKSEFWNCLLGACRTDWALGLQWDIDDGGGFAGFGGAFFERYLWTRMARGLACVVSNYLIGSVELCRSAWWDCVLLCARASLRRRHSDGLCLSRDGCTFGIGSDECVRGWGEGDATFKPIPVVGREGKGRIRDPALFSCGLSGLRVPQSTFGPLP